MPESSASTTSDSVIDLDELFPPGDASDEPPPEEVTFDPGSFERFCSKLWIDSKEQGLIRLKFLGSQRYLVDKVAAALAQGVHTFVVLKGRQIGISTVMLALDIYWLFKYPGLQGAVVTDTDDNRELFRSTIEQYIKTLPSKAQGAIRRHNRVQLLLKNRSRFIYMVAGLKKKGDLGRAKAVNFMHATECSSWGDEEGFGSLVNTLAQKNPRRLYVFESTARGYNKFFQVWEIAREAPDQCAIFIGWWLNELYQWPDDSPEFKMYWDGSLTTDERVWVGEVFERYGVEITPNQIAWWRWYCKVQMGGDEQLALQEMPPTEDYAFQLSGSKFFSAEKINRAYKIAMQRDALFFRYRFGVNFEDTEFLPTDSANADVIVWETPLARDDARMPSGVYVMGADPAFGSSEWADWFAGSMMRCYADRLVQVAEIGSPDWTDQQFAWALAHMCGWYGDTMLNLEMQGPGFAVYNELWNLKRKAGNYPDGDPRAGAFDVVGRIRDYLWKRQDTWMRGGQFAYQWQTNMREKVRMMSALRSYWERDMLEVASARCLQQFRNIHRTGDKIGGEGRAKDDFVISLAIATVAWNDWIMLEMGAQGRTYDKEHRSPEVTRVFKPLEASVIKYLDKQGLMVPGINDFRHKIG
jgi:hypothetical protein